MSQLITYLTFGGNCREAMSFYQHCLGGELQVFTLGDSPFGSRLPNTFVHFVLYASLKKDDLILLGTDMVNDDGLIIGNAVSIFIVCNSESEIRSYYKKFMQGGKVLCPLARGTNGSLFGNVVDRYGIQWLFQYSERQI